MHLDVAFLAPRLAETAGLARAAEAVGFDTAWTSETQHNPFLPLTLTAEHTARLGLGTAVAIGFARSPMTLAQVSWDLAAYSQGRFKLGLGTQIKAHIERRFGMPWPESPVGKLRDLILALRAIWHSWQTGEKLNVRSEHYTLTLMTPFFNPGPIAQPHIPLYIAGVNTGLAQLAGELCDGFHHHPFHTADYLRQVLDPALAAAGRPLDRSASVFVITRPEEREGVRQQIAFYASTPSYRPVLAHHGWGEVGERLSSLAARGKWADMPALIDDAMLAAFALEAPLADLAGPLKARYAGLLERVTLYVPFVPGERDADWRRLIAELAA